MAHAAWSVYRCYIRHGNLVTVDVFDRRKEKIQEVKVTSKSSRSSVSAITAVPTPVHLVLNTQ